MEKKFNKFMNNIGDEKCTNIIIGVYVIPYT